MFHEIESGKIRKVGARKTLADNLGIEILEYGDGFIKGKMPVDERTIQPFGILHGGASVAFAETLGSVASFLLVDGDKQIVGLEINANHLRSVSEGWVYGVVKPIHVGRKTHIWSIEITNEEGKMVCVSRLTCMVI
ncbi:1,4-dihydroxy-2-naphthoyl-CoA hydrolase [Spirosomataceae bacterium TFI 002]|nr:1,4-dihydroxy-2-naphthoyl-CoA hydrolase [Spirosomataceae bacterium TFI 002]